MNLPSALWRCSAAIGMQRLASVTRSPLYSHFSETLAGLSTVRAFGASARFEADNMAKIDANSNAMYILRALFRWASLRIEILNSLATFAVALLVVSSRGTITPSFGGAILNFALSTGGILGFAVVIATELEVRPRAVCTCNVLLSTMPMTDCHLLAGANERGGAHTVLHVRHPARACSLDP